MIWIEARCTFVGTNYSPRLAGQLTQLSFADENELGETGLVGRYKGQAMPYGSSTLLPPHQLTVENPCYGIEWLADTLAHNRSGLEKAGVSDFVLRVDLFHDGQCNFDLTSDLIRKIAASGAILALSCYEDADYMYSCLERAKKELGLS